MEKNTENQTIESEIKTNEEKKPIFSRIQFWQGLSVLFILLFIISLFVGFRGSDNTSITGATVISKDAAKEKVQDYIDTVLRGRATATIDEIKEENGLYKMKVNLAGQIIDSYATKDGKLFFPNVIDLDNLPEINQPTQEPETEEVPKTEKPEVELFVMSHCPFGLQMEKAILPVMKLLGDKANIETKFVDYIMHGKEEIDDNTIQYCIQKEQKEKYIEYLECFLKEGKSKECLTEVGIDTDQLDTCIEETDKEFKITQDYEDKESWSNGRFPKYEVHAELNDKYGIRGSPTLVINGVTVRTQRSPEAVKEAICNAFEEPPEECEEELDTKATSPGFGFSENPKGSSGECS